MAQAAVVFDGVWKKFRRGERHDTLRDLIPSLAGNLLRRHRKEQLEPDEFWVVKDVSFEVKRGEALGIIGSNGAGKSTALKLVTKILKPTHGLCLARGRVGALIEVAAGFHPDLTGRENVYLQGAIMGMKRAEIQAKFDEIVDFAGIGQFIDTPVKRYSSGMSARLGFSIAAHLAPDVLLVDEVLSVGDMVFQRRCVERMQETKRQGAAVVFISHDLAAVRMMCDQALLLEAGSVVCVGNTQTTLDRYVRASRRLDGNTAPLVTSSETIAEVIEVRIPPGRDQLSLRPGDPLKITLRVAPVCRVEQLMLVTYIVNHQTQTIAHNSNLPLHGIQGAGPGAVFEISVQLALNLLRGVYTLNFSIFDPVTQRHAWAQPPILVGVDELTSYNGVAHLDVQVAVTPVLDRVDTPSLQVAAEC